MVHGSKCWRHTQVLLLFLWSVIEQHGCRVNISLALGLMAITNDPLECGIWYVA